MPPWQDAQGRSADTVLRERAYAGAATLNAQRAVLTGEAEGRVHGMPTPRESCADAGTAPGGLY